MIKFRILFLYFNIYFWGYNMSKYDKYLFNFDIGL